MQTVSPIGTWSRTTHESVSFWMDPDELPTEVEDITEPVVHPDELPTVQVERASLFGDEPDTRPDVGRVIGVLRRRAGLPDPRPVQSLNRAGTPAALPVRTHSHGRQVQVERPLSQRAVSIERPIQAVRPVRVERPVHIGRQAPSIQRGPVSLTCEEPVPLEPRIVPWSFADEYGWWLAGMTVGSFFGTLSAGIALAAVVVF